MPNVRVQAFVAAAFMGAAALAACAAPSTPLTSTAPIADPAGQRCGPTTTVRGVAGDWPVLAGPTPDDRGVIVAARDMRVSPENQSSIVEIGQDSDERRLIAQLRGTPNPFAVSPDTRWIAAVEQSGELAAFGTGLKLIAFDGSSAQEVFSADESVSALAWSPDSQSLAFIADQRLRRIDLADRSVHEIAHAASPSFARGFHRSAWSPDGAWIVFSTNIYASFDRIAPDGSNRASFAHAHSFAWSPDGAMLAFAGDGISIARPDGSGVSDLVAGPVQDLSWSPDGGAIAFAGSDGYPTGPLCVLESDGTLTMVARCALAEMPIWSPDGQTILFAEVLDSPTSCDTTGNYRLAKVARRGGSVEPFAELFAHPRWPATP
jgi:Tol biopolymer transport system component